MSQANLVSNKKDVSEIGLRSLDLKTSYRSPNDDPLHSFYLPCLRKASVFKRSVGYFRSSLFALTGPDTIRFAQSGGRIQIICSPDLSPDDLQTIMDSYDRREEALEEALLKEFQELLDSSTTNVPARVLSTLISSQSLELRLAIRTDGGGLYHEKLGYFEDGIGNQVSFVGSANETLPGWSPIGNVESIEVFTSWGSQGDYERLQSHKEVIERVWESRDPHVTALSLSAELRDLLGKHAYADLSEVLKYLAPSQSPSSILPMQHQTEAILNWVANGRRGILKHATGSGKTITASLAIKDHAASGLPTLVVVPSRLLLRQWLRELRSLIPEVTILLAGDGNNTWRTRGRLAAMTISRKMAGHRIVLSTMQTASSAEFRSLLSSDTSKMLLVADEVHNLGSSIHSQVMEVDAGYRLGLSATPQRYGDPEGTKRIMDYFHGIVPPEFTLSDAIAAGRLAPYQYYPHPITLTSSEKDDWNAITQEINKEIARSGEDASGNLVISERAKLLLIKRSRIAKKAENKVGLVSRILKDHSREGQRWLVYCEDQDQLRVVLCAIRNRGQIAFEYHTSMEDDRSQHLGLFRQHGGILVSIRCLDEGVDIPEITHALILASSQNPRQFIQRRGRVLRASPGKTYAVLHDAIVVPVNLAEANAQETLLRTELARALEFAGSAANKSSEAQLRQMCIEFGINPDAMLSLGTEEEIHE